MLWGPRLPLRALGPNPLRWPPPPADAGPGSKRSRAASSVFVGSALQSTQTDTWVDDDETVSLTALSLFQLTNRHTNRLLPSSPVHHTRLARHMQVCIHSNIHTRTHTRTDTNAHSHTSRTSQRWWGLYSRQINVTIEGH